MGKESGADANWHNPDHKKLATCLKLQESDPSQFQPMILSRLSTAACFILAGFICFSTGCACTEIQSVKQTENRSPLERLEARFKGTSENGILLSTNYEVLVGHTDITNYFGVIAVHLTESFPGPIKTQYVELNFYQPPRSGAYYQDGRFHLAYGSEMFGGILELLKSGRPVYFHFDRSVLEGLEPKDHSAPAKFGYLGSVAGVPF